MKKILFTVFIFVGCQLSLMAQWQPTNLLDSFAIKTLSVFDNTLFAGTEGGGIFSTTDDGGVWTLKNSGLSNLNINTIAFDSSGFIYAGSNSLWLFISADSGNSWSPVNIGGTGTTISSIAVSGNNLFVGEVEDGVFLSANSGNSWTESGLCCESVLSVCADANGNVFAGTNASAVYSSVAPYTDWTQMNNGLPNHPVHAMVTSGSLLVAGTTGSGIFISDNLGATWTAANEGLSDLNVVSLVNAGQKLFAGTLNGGVFISINQGLNWLPVNDGLTILNSPVFAVSNNYLYAGFVDGSVWKRPLTELSVVAEVTSGINFELYPNPTTDRLFVNISDFENAIIEIYNFSGQLIKFEEPTNTSTFIDTKNFASGVYTVKVKKLKGISTRRFVKL